MKRTSCSLIYYLRKTRIDMDGKAPQIRRMREAEEWGSWIAAWARIFPNATS
ncbi:hypothetical protein [uncultured Alistipes sp.]|uniref:hypothetical protein n=1 Tax=uncultured Alistipes sp. TaxID=538949 RepID=UPI00266B9423|nr:hypothetical protein [uncultured Alistipes sp.]